MNVCPALIATNKAFFPRSFHSVTPNFYLHFQITKRIKCRSLQLELWKLSCFFFFSLSLSHPLSCFLSIYVFPSFYPLPYFLPFFNSFLPSFLPYLYLPLFPFLLPLFLFSLLCNSISLFFFTLFLPSLSLFFLYFLLSFPSSSLLCLSLPSNNPSCHSQSMNHCVFARHAPSKY